MFINFLYIYDKYVFKLWGISFKIISYLNI